jgi:hypothetical protein
MLNDIKQVGHWAYPDVPFFFATEIFSTLPDDTTKGNF